jgi:hypothetical protein
MSCDTGVFVILRGVFNWILWRSNCFVFILTSDFRLGWKEGEEYKRRIIMVVFAVMDWISKSELNHVFIPRESLNCFNHCHCFVDIAVCFLGWFYFGSFNFYGG